MYYYANVTFDSWETSLCHHGIKGQKWGLRRYQNEDGSLTAAGRQHYGYGDGQTMTKSDIRAYKKDYKKLQKLASKTDVNAQAERAQKYNNRAKAAAGVGAGLAGTAVAGKTVGLDALNKKQYDRWWNAVGPASEQARNAIKFGESGSYIRKLQDRTDKISKNVGDYNDKLRGFHEKGTKALSAAAAVSIGYAAYNKIKAMSAKSLTTVRGHNKAVQKYQAQLTKMQQKYGSVNVDDILQAKKKKQ